MRIPWMAGVLALMSCFSPSLFGTTLRLFSLQETLAKSSRILVGECLEFQEGFDQRGLPYTEYTFRLIERLKGDAAGRLFTVKQFGLSPESNRRSGGRGVTRIAGMPHYRPGSTYMLFLGPVSRLGFSSPVGLVQGAFRVIGQGAERRVVNGVGNRNLLIDTSRTLRERIELRRQAPQTGLVSPPSELIRGSVPYARFSGALRRMLRGDQLDRRQLGEALSEGGPRQ